MSHISI